MDAESKAKEERRRGKEFVNSNCQDGFDAPHGAAQVTKLQNGTDQHPNPFKDPPRKSSAIFGPQNYQKPSKAHLTPRPQPEKKGTKEHDK